MDCVEKAKMQIEQFGDLSILFSNCCKLYCMTTENISGFLKKYDLKDKKVLTVAGSGDHRLNSFLMGASDVVSFDVNDEDRHDHILDPEMFQKIEEYLEEDTCSFFHFLLFESDVVHNCVYHPFDNSLKKQKQLNSYLTPDSYYKLRSILQKKNNRFVNVGIDHLADFLAGEKFDAILLSNISDYAQLISYRDSLGNYKRIIDQLSSLLNEDGIMQVGYIYSRYSSYNSFSDFRVNRCRTKYFPIGEYQIEFFDSYYGDGTYDKSIVYQKVKK